MAMAGIRDLSIIMSPPAKRLAIKTFVSEQKKTVMREAILREIMRGGQVYFLHNSVETMPKMAEDLQQIVPEISLRMAHGQMRERELEGVMADFYHQRFNLLLCTTIIESGIDVPSANTMLINRADKFGLAQLHQLRGRVGRSHHQAYTYLLIPDKKAITGDAKKRLDAISTHDDLGAGFMLANHDLEIRGAGELLGEEQSGSMQAVGFTLYMELLDRAVAALKAGKTPALENNIQAQTEIVLKIPALLPEDYIADIHTRLTLYKRIANAANKQQIDDLKVEIIDRFGRLPQPAKNLFASAHLRLKAQALGIIKIDASLKQMTLNFSKEPQIATTKLIHLVQTQPQQYQLQGAEQLKITFPKAVEAGQLMTQIDNYLAQFK
jgi:transcription-repair coupling factor (superfamily II helicase)